MKICKRINAKKTNLDNSNFLVVDIGGTNISLALINGQGKLILNENIKTLAQRSPEIIITDILMVLKKFIKENPTNNKPLALGIGTPGLILPEKGIVVNAPNLKNWINLPLAKILSDNLNNLPVFIENDANLFALGEGLLGAGQNLNNFIGITLGTGVGGGLILNNCIWSGNYGSSGEIGHVPVIYEGGAPCGCGSYGCLETLASANSMVRLAQNWLKESKETKYQGEIEQINSQKLFLLAQEDDPMALNIFKTAGQALGFVLAGIVNMLGIEGAVFGGGGSGAFEFLKPHIEAEIKKRSFVANNNEFLIKKTTLKNKAPLIGALALMLQKNIYSHS